MSDDIAADFSVEQQQAAQEALEERLRREREAREGRPSLKECLDCGIEIPEARRAVGGITRCVECQNEVEKRGR